MDETTNGSFEAALARAEQDATATLKTAQSLMSALKKYAIATKVGALKDLTTAMNEVEKTELALRQQIAVTKTGWTFDSDAYMANGSYVKEVIETASKKGLKIYERDDRLYSYPVLVRLMAPDKVVRIDKKSEKRLRPSVLAAVLKEMRDKKPAFRSEPFLEAIYNTYGKSVKIRNQGMLTAGTVVALLDIYELLTLLPGQAREYSKQEFARDIYLLDKSGITATKNGAKLRLHPGSGRVQSKLLSVINEYGEEKTYQGISFTTAEEALTNG